MAKLPPFVPSQPRASLFRRARHGLLRCTPAFVWGAAVFGVYALASVKPVIDGFAGLVQQSRFDVVAPVAGRVETLLVSARSTVEKGQLIGRIDGAHLEIRTKKVRHAIAELRAQMDRERAVLDTGHSELQRELDTEQRRFVRDLENARIDALTTRAQIEEVRVREAGLQFDVERQKLLVEEELFSEAELIRTRTQFERLGARIAQLAKVLSSQNDRIAAVYGRLSDYQTRKTLPPIDMDRMLGEYAWRIAAEESELEMIALERTRLEFRSPASGIVSAVHVPEGQFVADGRRVLTILDATPKGAVVYVPSAAVPGLAPGDPVELDCASQPGERFRGTIAHVGLRVAEVPPQALVTPGRREWAVPITLELAEGLQLRPGELVRARFAADQTQ